MMNEEVGPLTYRIRILDCGLAPASRQHDGNEPRKILVFITFLVSNQNDLQFTQVDS